MAFQYSEVRSPVDINVDINPYELPPTVWSSGQNISFDNIRSNRVKGATEVFASTSPLTIQPLFAMEWNDSANAVWLYGDEDSIYKISPNGTEIKMGPAVGTYNTTFKAGWQGDVFNGVGILNNGSDDPQYTDTATTVVDLANWPANHSCKVIRPFKNYLVALGITESGSNYPSRVLWSSPADAGAVPGSWDTADPSEQAGQTDLADTKGSILDGKTLGDSFIIYKEDAVWSMDFIGGTFVFRFRKLFNDNVGILAEGCVAEFEGKHFVVTKGDVYVHNGSSKKSIATNRILSFLDSIDDTYFQRTKVVADHTNKEVLLYFVPSDESTGLSQTALTWNWVNDTWGVRDLIDVSYIAEGGINQSSSNDWDSDSATWDSDSTSWNQQDQSLSKTRLLTCDYTNSKFLELNTGTTWDGTSYTTTIEKTGVDFEEDFSFKKINSIQPHLSGDSGTVVNISVGYENPQNSGIIYEGPYPFTIGTDTKINCRVNGRNIALKIESVDDALWSLTGYTVEWRPTGARR